jgi:negative regulator of replication initiation
MGHRLALEVSEDLYKSLAKKAQQSGQSTEGLVVQLLTAATQEEAQDPLEKFIGAFNSQEVDWADQHDKYFGEAVTENLKVKANDSHHDG